MSFAATEFEFRYRFYVILAIFAAGYLLYSLDQVNVSVALTNWIFVYVHRNPDSWQADVFLRTVFAAGALSVTLAALVRSWAEAYLHSSVVHDVNLHSDRLVADGPYRHVRNPLYLGNILLALGMALLASRIGFVVLVAGMTLFVYRLILREEAGLLAAQGENYRRYFESVPRLLPSLRARVPAGEAMPRWADGFAGEAFMWICAVACAVFALTEHLSYFWMVLGAGFVVRLLQDLGRGKANQAGTEKSKKETAS